MAALVSFKRPFRVLLIGVGTVGGAVLRILQQQRTGQANAAVEVAAVMSRHVTQRLQRQAPDYLKWLGKSQIFNNWDELHCALAPAANSAIGKLDAVIELAGGVDNCLPIYRYFLQRGIPIITANKALLAECGTELFPLARQNGTSIACEASCGGCIPILQTLLHGLRTSRIHEFHGVLNGTCNFILSQMAAEGRDYAEVLREAQANGLAEADPFLDIAGIDTAHKLAILSMLSFGHSLKLQNIPTGGINDLKAAQIAAGQQLGLSLKLLASAKFLSEQSAVALRVGPCYIPQNTTDYRQKLHLDLTASPLANLAGSFNGISFYGENVGHIYLEGHGAGASATAAAVLSDLHQLANGSYAPAFSEFPNWPRAEKIQDQNKWNQLEQNWLLFVAPENAALLENSLHLLFTQDDKTVFCAPRHSEAQLQDIQQHLDINFGYIPILQLPQERLDGDLQ